MWEKVVIFHPHLRDYVSFSFIFFFIVCSSSGHKLNLKATWTIGKFNIKEISSTQSGSKETTRREIEISMETTVHLCHQSSAQFPQSEHLQQWSTHGNIYGILSLVLTFYACVNRQVQTTRKPFYLFGPFGNKSTLPASKFYFPGK